MREPKKDVHKAPSAPRDYQTIESWRRKQDAEAEGLTSEEFYEREMQRDMEESIIEDAFREDQPKKQKPDDTKQ